MARQPGRMSNKPPRFKVAADRAAEDPRRSPLFRWLKKNHKLIPPATAVRRDWGPLRDKAAASGITDDSGNPPSLRIMRDTWRKVCAVVAAEAQAGRAVTTASRKLYPRDMPVDWRPRESVPPPSNAPAIRKPKNASELVNNVNITPDEAIEGVLRVIHEASYGPAVPFQPRLQLPPALTGPTAGSGEKRSETIPPTISE